ncbi:MAG: response regulator [Desulfohalobiaceae bacterium]|nr:response regulator [Desulfohalobiaceae bacterium]
MLISIVAAFFADDFQGRLAGHFKEKGYRVKTAQTNLEVLEYAASEDIDVLFVDLTEQQRQGLEAIQQIHSLNSEVQILVMVRKNDVQASIAAMKRGAYDDIADPFDWTALDSKIEAAYTRKLQSRRIGEKRGFRQKLEDHFAAAALAEHGTFEMAKDIFQGGLKGKKDKTYSKLFAKKKSASRRRKK